MDKIVTIYTDGGVIGSNPSKQGGTWAWCGLDRDGNRVMEKSGVLLPDSRHPELSLITNNHTEFYAVCKALASLPDGWSGRIVTDSMVVVSRFDSARGRKKKKYPKNVPIPWVHAFWRHVGRMGNFYVHHVNGHAGVTHNEWCDEECNRQRQAFERHLREAA